jgi:tRNA 2-thiouridine synthesizing protein E
MGRPEHFPHALADWSLETALEKSREEGIELEGDHWAVILALQEFFAHHDDSKQVNRRLLHDALNEKFHHKGGS